MLISSILFKPTGLPAQSEVVKQFEIPLSHGGGYQIASNDTNGLIVFRTIASQSLNFIELIHLDTALQAEWSGYINVEHGWTVTNQYIDNKKCNFLLTSSNPSDYNFRLVQIDLEDRTYFTVDIRNLIPFMPAHFETTSKGALIGGYFNRVPVVMFFDIETKVAHILPGLFNEPGELTQIKVNDDESFDVLISARNYVKKKTIWIKKYDARGNLLGNVMLDPGENSLIFGSTLRTEANENIIAGVYGTRNGDYSRGLFIARVDEEGNQLLQYYNFADLENFFNYMKAKRQKRVKDRIARKKIKGKKIKFSYRFLVHELVPYKNQFILLGEAFYPRYTTTNRSGFGLGRDNQLVFDGYQYTHAVVLGIDAKGKVIWDNSFEINDVKTFTLQQFVKMDPQENQIVLLYLFDNEIRTKIIRDNQVLEGKRQSRLSKNGVDETIAFNRIKVDDIDYWFKNTFYAVGTRTMIDAGNRTRGRFFFINKITYK